MGEKSDVSDEEEGGVGYEETGSILKHYRHFRSLKIKLRMKRLLIRESQARVRRLESAYAEELQRRKEWDEVHRRGREAESRRLSGLEAEAKGIKLQQEEEEDIWNDVLCELQSNRDKARKKASHQYHQAIRDSQLLQARGTYEQQWEDLLR
jgi:hypothetical protein